MKGFHYDMDLEEPTPPGFEDVAHLIHLEVVETREEWAQHTAILLTHDILTLYTDDQGDYTPPLLVDDAECWSLSDHLQGKLSRYLKQLPVESGEEVPHG